MASLADSLVSSADRKLSMRARPDLSAKRQRYQGRIYWVIKDPVGLNYFRFQEEEFAILNMLDGNTSLNEIKERFEAEFPPQKITVEEVQRFLGMLHQSGLIIADVPGQGHQLRKRRDKKKRKELTAKFSNVLAIRFKGFDPERLLNAGYPFVAWFYKPLTVFCCVLMMLAAGSLVLVQFGEFQSRLPTFHEFFGYKNWLLLAVTMGLTKILHEFGHGMTCKHFGGECHEIGVLILVLTPCLYCNVSDSWMLKNKWHRAAIGAAGMYVEIVLAAICTFIWWFSDPTSTLNQLSLSIMFVSSVSTILFNANPLLRYDGYYILSDLVEIPNLRQKSSTILNRKLGKWFLGLEETPDPFLPKRNQMFFALYTVAAVCYRWFIVLAILFFLTKVFEPYGLKIIGQMIACMALFSMVGMPLWKLGKFFYVPGRIEKVKKLRMWISLAAIIVVLGAILFTPLPYRVVCTFEIQPRGAQTIYAPSAGLIDTIVARPGEVVEADAPIIKLRNVDLQMQVEELQAEYEQAELAWKNKLREAFEDKFAFQREGQQVKQLEERKKSALRQLQNKQRELEQLTLRAPIAGTIIPPPQRSAQGGNDKGILASWTGTPFDDRNQGAHLNEGDEVCVVGNPHHFDAVIVIDQTDRDFIEKDSTVEIRLANLPGKVFESHVASISPETLKVSPRALSNKVGGDLATETDESGLERPIKPTYQANAPLDDLNGEIVIGTRGTAKIHAGYQSLGQRGWRYLSRTFNFEL
jgi:putative peptide zinc metalloprotease protein